MSDDAHPTADAEARQDDTREPAPSRDPDHQSEAADLDQRDAGAQEEQVGDEANFRAEEDESPPDA